jgi:hypothetical protein
MKRVIPLVALAIVVLASPFARAEGSLSDAQLDAIRTNCVDAQISLQHAQGADKLTRINRGYRYEAILKLMASFNSRVAENKIDAPGLITIASDYQKTWESFRSEYTDYDDAMTALIQVDCKTEPTTFHDQLVALREKRTGLNNRVNEFEALLNKYQTGVDTIKNSLGKS